MTAYHGGKQKIGKEIAKIINDTILEKKPIGYCEPFCGMLGVYQHILIDNKLAGDIDKSVILMWKEVQSGWIPPDTCDEKYYNELRQTKDIPSSEKGFIGHQFSYGGQYFSSYASNYGKNENQKRASDKVVKIGKKLSAPQSPHSGSSSKFTHGDYTQFSNLKNYIIYCDPPYSKASQKYPGDFDTDKFWEWCKMMSKHNIVFVSEYSAPDGFAQVIWTKYIKTGGYKGSKNTKSEKLYKIIPVLINNNE